MSLSSFFKKHKIQVTEGYSEEIIQQCIDIKQILKDNSPTKIMEIGFNAGHSAELFLKNSEAVVYSFDLGEHFHQYLKYGKQYINNTYINRHILILGDSTIRIPIFAQNNNIKFDIIFIDGGHSYDVAYADLMNCRKLATENTIIIMDDIIKKPEFQAGHTVGPSKAWNKLIENNLLIETSHSDYSKGRGQSVGNYIF